jgi:alanine racemase
MAPRPSRMRVPSSWDCSPLMTLRSQLIAIQELAMNDPWGTAPRTRRRSRCASGWSRAVRRRLPTSCPERHADARVRTQGADGGPRLHGHGHGGPDRNRRGARGQPVVLWGEGLPVDEVAAAAARSATSCCARWRLGSPSRSRRPSRHRPR